MPLAGQDALDLSKFGLTGWQPASLASANNGPLQNIDALKIDQSRIVIGVKDASESGIEWRFGPPLHIGAMSPQLLYQATAALLSNSFLTVMPPGVAAVLRDADIVARMFTPNARDRHMLHVYQGWVTARLRSFHQLDGYMAAIYRDRRDGSDVGSIWRVTGGSRTDKIAAAFLGDKIDWTKPWHCRFNLKGHALKAKWWTYDVIEPESWDLVGADSTHSHAGMMGFAATVHGGVAKNVWGLDWYAWSADPDVSAPLYPCD
jgi:hypothetical protein